MNLPYPLPLTDYPAASLWNALTERISIAPFNLFAFTVFALAIIHTFCHRYFLRLANEIDEGAKEGKPSRTREMCSRVFHLLGEVEIIFALWLIPLFVGFVIVYGWDGLTEYLNWLTFEKRKFVEPVFVVFVMCVSATRPVIQFSEDIISFFAKIGTKMFGSQACGWWAAIICVGALLGSFITEPAAITICAMLLSKHFFKYEPSQRFKYATLGLLLSAISAGGVLTHFSAPPVLMVVSAWNWDTAFMFYNFGINAGLAIFASSLIILGIFKREFAEIDMRIKNAPIATTLQERVPAWIVVIHLIFLAAIVVELHHPALMIFTFLAFAAFVEITREYQYRITFKTQLLVGLFLAALVTHGSLQGWWIEPVLTSFGNHELFFGALTLTAFNDNAAITYLATLVPNFDDSMKYMVMAGAIAGGGLTVIANAPNPAGISILSKYFAGGVSPMRLFLWATIPTAVICAFFLLF